MVSRGVGGWGERQGLYWSKPSSFYSGNENERARDGMEDRDGGWFCIELFFGIFFFSSLNRQYDVLLIVQSEGGYLFTPINSNAYIFVFSTERTVDDNGWL